MEFSPCKDRNSPNWQAGFGPAGAFYLNGSWNFPAAWQWHNLYPFAPDPMTFYVPPYYSAQAACAVTYLPLIGIEEPVEMQLYCQTTGEVLKTVSRGANIFKEGGYLTSHDTQIPVDSHGRNYIWRVRGGIDKPPPWNELQAVGGNCYVAIHPG
jgi:hypothetical protein